MRVTNSMLVSNFMNNLNTNLTKLDKLQTQLARNRKYAHISDDPVSVIYSQQARYKLRRLEHYSQNVEISKEWLTQVEGGVLELNELIKSAYESTIDASTDVKSQYDKTNAAQYIAQLRDQVVQTLNTAYGTKYVFGGYNTTGYNKTDATVAPFTTESYTEFLQERDEDGNLMFDSSNNPIYVQKKDADGNLMFDSSNNPVYVEVERHKLYYNGLDLSDPANNSVIQSLMQDVMTFDVGPGIEMPVSINGLEVAFYATDDSTTPPTYSNLFNLLDDLYVDFCNRDAHQIGLNINKLQDAQDHLMALTAELGGRSNRLDILSARYEQDYLNYTQMKSDAEDADQAEIIMQYKMAEAVYKAALSTGAYIIQPTLMDFLR